MPGISPKMWRLSSWDSVQDTDLYQPRYPYLPNFCQPDNIDIPSIYLYKVGFPTISLTPEEIDLFECDPHELFYHHRYPFYNFYNPFSTAITLITDLVKHLGKDFTQGLIGNPMEILICYTCST